MTGPGDDLRLYLLFTPELCAAEPWRTLDAALAGGVDLVQWRVKTRDPTGLERCLACCAPHGVPVIVNDHVELAVRTAAAGAHVGQHDLPPREARAMLREEQWLGVSTHDRDELARALEGGADHVGFGPMFATATKGYADGQREGALRATLAASPVPVYAIGGITAANVALVLREGAARIAVSSAILQARDPEAAARALRSALRSRDERAR